VVEDIPLPGRECSEALGVFEATAGKTLSVQTMLHRSKRKWHELDLLCRAGVGIEPIAPAVCRTLREIVGADAASLFWMDAQQMPAGLFHDNAADSALDLFVNEYDRLFTGTSEINASQIAAMNGRPVGQLMNPERSYFRSNTFNLLVRASGHFHTLDLRVDVAKRARAVVMLFREEPNPFDEIDASYLSQALPYLQRAIEGQSADGRWERSYPGGHMLVDRSGTRLLTLSAEANEFLKACTIVGQNVRLVGPTTMPPRFAQDLCRRLESSSMAQDVLEVPGGRLLLTATLMHPPVADATAQVLISLEMEQPKRLKAIENLLDLPLSPLQRSIALVAATGGTRADCLTSAGTSKEALKKHLATIYRTVGVTSWEELAKALQ
jgi:hypothetical protein